MAAIRQLSYCTVAVPLAAPIAFATSGVATRCFGLLKLEDAEGAQGLAYAYLGPAPVSLVEVALRELLVPALSGKDASEIAARWGDMSAASQLHGRAGAVMRAMSLVDIALWDLQARRNARPLYRELGGEHAESVPAYAAGGYYGAGKGIPELVAELESLRALGFRAIKMKTGKFGPEEERRRVAAARAALPPDTDLMLDANNAWPDLETALRYLLPMREYRPFWIEEPFPEDDAPRLGELARATGLRIATGENEANPLRFAEMIARGVASFIQPDANVCGGITPWMRIARMATGLPVMVCPHAYHNLHVHLLAGCGLPGLLEFMPGKTVMNFGQLIDEDLRCAGGRVFLPDRPGLGFEFDERAVARHSAMPAGAGSGPWSFLA